MCLKIITISIHDEYFQYNLFIWIFFNILYIYILNIYEYIFTKFNLYLFTLVETCTAMTRDQALSLTTIRDVRIKITLTFSLVHQPKVYTLYTLWHQPWDSTILKGMPLLAQFSLPRLSERAFGERCSLARILSSASSSLQLWSKVYK